MSDNNIPPYVFGIASGAFAGAAVWFGSQANRKFLESVDHGYKAKKADLLHTSSKRSADLAAQSGDEILKLVSEALSEVPCINKTVQTSAAQAAKRAAWGRVALAVVAGGLSLYSAYLALSSWRSSRH